MARYFVFLRGSHNILICCVAGPFATQARANEWLLSATYPRKGFFSVEVV